MIEGSLVQARQAVCMQARASPTCRWLRHMRCSTQVLVSRLPVESGQRDLDKRRPSDIPSARDRMRRQPMVGPQGVINRQHAYSRSRLEEYEALQRGMG